MKRQHGHLRMLAVSHHVPQDHSAILGSGGGGGGGGGGMQRKDDAKGAADASGMAGMITLLSHKVANDA